MNITATEKVYLQDSGQELSGTGLSNLDRLLNDATPETLAVGLVCLRLSETNPVLASKIEGCIEERLQPFIDGELDLDKDAEEYPTRQWLALLEGMQIGRASVRVQSPMVEGERERLTQDDAEFVQARQFELDDFARLSVDCQRWYCLLRNLSDVKVDGGDFDCFTPRLRIGCDALGEAYQLGRKLLGLDMPDLIQAQAELEQERLVTFDSMTKGNADAA